MPSLIVNKPNTRVGLQSERIKIRQNINDKDELLRDIPLRDIDRVVLAEGVNLSNSALIALLKRKVPISIYGWNGQYLGAFQPPSKTHSLARKNQYEKSRLCNFNLKIGGKIITAKIYNQRRILQRLLSNRKRKDNKCENEQNKNNIFVQSQKTIAELHVILSRLNNAKCIETLRGLEGAASALYFSAWSKYLPPEFPFDRRSKRPPLNPINSCISFGATLLYSEMVNCIHSHGLDPGIGVIHTTDNNRWSLALDLIEPFRPVIVEALALDLVSHKLLDDKDFEHIDGGVYLNESGRRVFIKQYESRLERQFMSECVNHRTNLRQQIENQAIMFKQSLNESDKLEPFLIN